eukprot:351806-Rhodomonas_salina.1
MECSFATALTNDAFVVACTRQTAPESHARTRPLAVQFGPGVRDRVGDCLVRAGSVPARYAAQ